MLALTRDALRLISTLGHAKSVPRHGQQNRSGKNQSPHTIEDRATNGRTAAEYTSAPPPLAINSSSPSGGPILPLPLGEGGGEGAVRPQTPLLVETGRCPITNVTPRSLYIVKRIPIVSRRNQSESREVLAQRSCHSTCCSRFRLGGTARAALPQQGWPEGVALRVPRLERPRLVAPPRQRKHGAAVSRRRPPARRGRLDRHRGQLSCRAVVSGAEDAPAAPRRAPARCSASATVTSSTSPAWTSGRWHTRSPIPSR